MARDMAMNWLRKNDPDYKKRQKLGYPYLNNRQIDERSRREIAISGLGSNRIKTAYDITEDEYMRVKDLMS